MGPVLGEEPWEGFRDPAELNSPPRPHPQPGSPCPRRYASGCNGVCAVLGTVKVPPGFRLQGVFFSRERGHSALIASLQPGGQYVADGFAPGEPYHP
ncbi:MAG: hypothetical protein AB1486_35420, partial [Planctomycetota bacterium]